MSRKTLRIAIKNEKRGGESGMKRYLVCLLMLITLISLAGCNSQEFVSEEEPQKTETSSSNEDVLEVLLIVSYHADSSTSSEIIDYLSDEKILVNEWRVETGWADNSNIEDQMDYAARKGFDMVVCASEEFEGAMRLLEPQYPDIEFVFLTDW